MTTKADCKTQWHVVVAYLHQQKSWLPTHLLQGRDTDFGFIGSSGEQRVRELARNDPKVISLHPELSSKVERKRGAEIGLDPRYEFFRYAPQLSDRQRAARKVALFEAGAPAEQIFAV